MTPTAPMPSLQAPPAEFNFAAHVMALNEGRAGKLAFRDDVGALSYGELAQEIRRFAGLLGELGLRREERLLVLMHDGNDWPVVFLGALYAGVVPVAVNTLLTPGDYAYMLAHCRARAAVVSAPLAGTLAQAMARAPGHELRHVLVSRPTGALPEACRAWRMLADAVATATPRPQPAPTLADEIGFWLYSSGSTGRPKGTVHTHSNLYWTAEAYAKPVLGLREDDLVFSAAKLFFAYGLGNALTFPLCVGASVVLMAERPTPAAVFQRLTTLRPTVYYGVPTLYAAMLAAPDLPARDAVALRVCASAGEALPREIGERFRDHFGCDILDGLGSTEMLHIFLSNRPGDVRYGSSGKPVPGYALELRSEEGASVPPGEVGDLYIQGPSAALMYWNDRTRSAATFQGAWLKSGDKYTLDADGYYHYAGRSDDMLKVSGQYVSPFEVEAALIQHTSVLEAAVIGMTDAQGLTKTKAFVVLKDGAAGDEALAELLQAFVKDKLAPHKYPRYIEFLCELPKTATGKIQRFRLREREQAAAEG